MSIAQLEPIMVIRPIKKLRGNKSMSKEKNGRRVGDNEAMAKLRMIKTSPQKLNLVAQLIRNKPVAKALSDLRFSKKRVAKEVSSCLQSAIANAENNHQLDVDRLFVKEAFVGKAITMRRFRPRARGRTGRLRKPFSHLTVVVSERQETV